MPTRTGEIVRWRSVFGMRVLPALLCVSAVLSCSPARMERYPIVSDGAPAAIGPYTQAIMAGGTLFISGQLPLDPKTGEMVKGDMRQQITQVMSNLGAILQQAGLDFEDAVQVQIYLTDLDDFGVLNEVYGAYFCSPPARVTIQASRLPRDAGVEIAMIAAARRGARPACIRNRPE